MSNKINCCINKSNAIEILGHLLGCDDQFIPQLSLSVNLEEYAFKIFKNAVRFEAIDEGKIIGLVAIYCNDEKKISAFITSVSVDRNKQGLGIGSELVDAGIEYVKCLGFKNIKLEVDSKNIKAINLYRKKGFILIDNRSTVIAMQLEV